MAKKETKAPKGAKTKEISKESGSWEISKKRKKKEKEPKEGVGAGKKVLIVLLAVIFLGGAGAGGYFGWQYLSNRNNTDVLLEGTGSSLADEATTSDGANQGDTGPLEVVPFVPSEDSASSSGTETTADQAKSQVPAESAVQTPTAVGEVATAVLEVGADVAGASTSLALTGSLPILTQPEGEGGTDAADSAQVQSAFEFSQETFSLPADVGLVSSALEQQVHDDVNQYLSQLDDRPGVQMTTVILCGETTSPDGYRRELVYALGNRYAVTETTLFDYGMLAGPMALDYDSAGNLVRLVLPREGESFEQSIATFCQEEVDVARRMTKGNYDLELLAKMVKNATAYIQRNNLNVDFFRLGNQVYNRDGSLYMASVHNPEISSSADTTGTQTDAPMTEEELIADYQYYKNLPQ